MISTEILWFLIVACPVFGLVVGLLASIPLARENKAWTGYHTTVLFLCVVLSPFVLAISAIIAFATIFHSVVKFVIEHTFHVTR